MKISNEQIFIETLNSVGIEGYIPLQSFLEKIKNNKLTSEEKNYLNKYEEDFIKIIYYSNISSFLNQSQKIEFDLLLDEYYFYHYWKTAKQVYNNPELFYLTREMILLLNSRIRRLHYNKYRNINVYLSGIDVPLCEGNRELIEELIDKYTLYINNQTNMNIYDLLKLHILFEMIHPFIDGNGRVGRLILNYLNISKLKNNYLIYWDYKNKQNYYNGLQEGQKWIINYIKKYKWETINKNWNEFIEDYMQNTDVSVLKENMLLIK